MSTTMTTAQQFSHLVEALKQRYQLLARTATPTPSGVRQFAEQRPRKVQRFAAEDYVPFQTKKGTAALVNKNNPLDKVYGQEAQEIMRAQQSAGAQQQRAGGQQRGGGGGHAQQQRAQAQRVQAARAQQQGSGQPRPKKPKEEQWLPGNWESELKAEERENPFIDTPTHELKKIVQEGWKTGDDRGASAELDGRLGGDYYQEVQYDRGADLPDWFVAPMQAARRYVPGFKTVEDWLGGEEPVPPENAKRDRQQANKELGRLDEGIAQEKKLRGYFQTVHDEMQAKADRGEELSDADLADLGNAQSQLKKSDQRLGRMGVLREKLGAMRGGWLQRISDSIFSEQQQAVRFAEKMKKFAEARRSPQVRAFAEKQHRVVLLQRRVQSDQAALGQLQATRAPAAAVAEARNRLTTSRAMLALEQVARV